MIEFADILQLHDESYTASMDIRRKAADDLLFARVSQWDDPYLNTTLEYRGQFDMIRKARRQNLSEFRANPVQVSYVPGDDGTDEVADIMERKYRYDMATPAAKQAVVIAQQDQLDCGMGAWRIATDYSNSMRNEQYIKREPIHEANNRVFRDPNCNMPDGSDARYLSVVWTVTALGWESFAEEIGVSTDTPSTFRPPEESHTFPWTYEDKSYNISEFYYRDRVTKTAYLFEDDVGKEKLVKEEDVDALMDELMEDNFNFVEEREYETYEVRKYWVSGGGVLNGEDGELIAGTEIPIVVLYGEVSKVENMWVWEGIVRLAKDPQRLRNFMMSYIADIAAKGARQRPYFRMSQIQGLEWQFEEGGPDDNRPFKVLNDFDEDGTPLEGGPVAYEQPPEMPAAAAGLLEAVTVAIDDVTNPGIPQDIASSELSGKAVTALQNQLGQQTYTYLDNYALSLQREAEIYASMVPQIYDTPRSIGLLGDDGAEELAEVNNLVLDTDTLTLRVVMDLTKGSYSVRTKVTPSYTSRRDQQRSQKIELYAASAGNPDAQNVLLLEIMMLDESESEVSKQYARQKLLDMGLVEADTDEDQEYLQAQEDQEPPPDPMLIAAQAEQAKADADMAKTEVDKFNAETNKFKAETERYKAMIEAKVAGVKIKMTGVESQGKVLDNALKGKELKQPPPQAQELTFDPRTGGFA